MPRSAPGAATGCPSTSTSPAVGGCCGDRPAISRRIVLLPQPLGPRMPMNSPLSGRSSTAKVTSWIAVKSFGLPRVVGLRHVAELDDPRQAQLLRLAEAIDDLPHAHGQGGRLRIERIGVRGVHRFNFFSGFATGEAVDCPAGSGNAAATSAGLKTSAVKSSQARSRPRTHRCRMPSPPYLVREQFPLDPVQQPVDRQGDQGMIISTSRMWVWWPRRCDVLMMSPSPPASPPNLNQLGQHDVAEGQAEQAAAAS